MRASVATLAVALTVASPLTSGCSSKAAEGLVDANLTTENLGQGADDLNAAANNVAAVDTNIDAIAASVPSHSYASREGDNYAYVAAVSEEDAKKGQAAGDVSMYAFRGVKSGVYVISAVDESSRTQARFECSNPCAVIKVTRPYLGISRIAYNPKSVIGAVFADAFAGYLQPSHEPSEVSIQSAPPVTPEASYRPSSPVPSPDTTQPSTPDPFLDPPILNS